MSILTAKFQKAWKFAILQTLHCLLEKVRISHIYIVQKNIRVNRKMSPCWSWSVWLCCSFYSSALRVQGSSYTLELYLVHSFGESEFRDFHAILYDAWVWVFLFSKQRLIQFICTHVPLQLMQLQYSIFNIIRVLLAISFTMTWAFSSALNTQQKLGCCTWQHFWYWLFRSANNTI